MSTLTIEQDQLMTVETCKAVEYFQSVYESAVSAAHAAGGFVKRDYSIGGYTIRLSFAGPALVTSLTPALEHLEAREASEPALTVFVWDSASTGEKMLPPPWGANDCLARGVIQGYNDERIYTSFQHGSGAVNMLDSALNSGIFWVPAADDLVYWEKGAPLRTILHWWFSHQDRQLVHAAAVGIGRNGVLIGGKGGSGKSTTALSCLGSQLSYAGDDYSLLGFDSERTVYSLYNSAKLDRDHLRRFPELQSQISNPDRPDEEKALLFVNQYYADRVASEFTVGAILLPRVTGQPQTRLRQASAAKALTALAPSTIFQLPRAGNEAFKFLSRFVRELPCYELELGTDISQIPMVIEEFLRET